MLFLFTRVCHNLANMIRGTLRPFDWYTVATMLLVVCASFAVCQHNDFVAEERLLTLCLQVYSLLNLCPLLYLQAFVCGKEQRGQSINTTGTLICVLLILTTHMQNTYDTPFLTIFVLVFGSHSFLKFLNLTLLHTQNGAGEFWVAFKFLCLCVDTVIFAVILELGVRTSMDSERKYNNSASELQLLSCLGGVLLYIVIN